MASRDKYTHPARLISDYANLSVRDMMKYVLLNEDEIKVDGVSHLILSVVVNKFLDLNPPNIESEDN